MILTVGKKLSSVSGSLSHRRAGQQSRRWQGDELYPLALLDDSGGAVSVAVGKATADRYAAVAGKV